MNELVSVIMPAHNAAPYIGQAITSILEQTHSDLELIIIDDASTDNTQDLISQYSDPRVRLHTNNSNLGYLATCNIATKYCKGDYFTFQDADDWSNPDRLRKQLNFMKEKNLSACGTGLILTSETGRTLRKKYFLTGGKKIQSSCLEGHVEACTASIMASTAVLKKTGLYRHFFQYGAEDVDWFYRLVESYTYDNLQQPLYYYRFCPGSITESTNILAQQASLDFATYLALERRDTDTDTLTKGNIAQARAVWKTRFETLSSMPLAEYILKNNHLSSKSEYVECFKLWSRMISANGPFKTKIKIIVSGTAKLIIGESYYRRLRKSIV